MTTVPKYGREPLLAHTGNSGQKRTREAEVGTNGKALDVGLTLSSFAQ